MHLRGGFPRQALHIVAVSAASGTTYGARRADAAAETALFLTVGACYASGKAENTAKIGSDAAGDAVILS